MKVLIKKQKKEYIPELKREITISKGRVYYADDNKDFSCNEGTILKKDLKKTGLVKTNRGKEFYVFDAGFNDLYKRIKRKAQIIPLKDISFIISQTGIDNKSRVVDAGAGSGALSCFLAHICKDVVTYEIRDDFIEVVEANKKFLGLKNLKIKKKDVYKGIDEKNADLIVLDLPEPWKAIKSAEKALKIGGFLVCYSPTIPQIVDFVNAVRKEDCFVHIKTIEVSEREWDIEDRKVRPKSKEIGHSGFISLCRKVK